MAKVLVSDTNLSNIADAIRSKNGTTKSYKVAEMATAIGGISVGNGTSEDLSSELSTQNSLITTQETTIDSIISALEGKAAGGSDGATLETCNIELYVSKSRPYQITYTTINDENLLETIYTTSMSGTNNITCVKGTPITIVIDSDQLEPYVYIREIVNGNHVSPSGGINYSLFSFNADDYKIACVSSIDCGTNYTNVYISIELDFGIGPGPV